MRKEISITYKTSLVLRCKRAGSVPDGCRSRTGTSFRRSHCCIAHPTALCAVRLHRRRQQMDSLEGAYEEEMKAAGKVIVLVVDPSPAGHVPNRAPMSRRGSVVTASKSRFNATRQSMAMWTPRSSTARPITMSISSSWVSMGTLACANSCWGRTILGSMTVSILLAHLGRWP